MTTLVFLLVLWGCTPESASDSTVATDTTRTEQVQQVAYVMDDASVRVFDRTMDFARQEDLHERSTGAVMQAVGEYLEGTPYVAGILDEPGEESLMCRLDGFDCVTFVETALAMARGITNEDYSAETFRENVLDSRYRDGEMDGYCSRVHYFTEWVVENEERGNVRDITSDVGGEPLEKRFNFMTENRERYPRLVDNDELFECIEDMERGLAQHSFHYVPQERISEAYDGLEGGDIVALVTDIEGLDVTHTGLVYDHGDGRKGLLHASTSGGVLVSPDLQRYVMNNSRQIGILVARPTAE